MILLFLPTNWRKHIQNQVSPPKIVQFPVQIHQRMVRPILVLFVFVLTILGHVKVSVHPIWRDTQQLALCPFETMTAPPIILRLPVRAHHCIRHAITVIFVCLMLSLEHFKVLFQPVCCHSSLQVLHQLMFHWNWETHNPNWRHKRFSLNGFSKS